MREAGRTIIPPLELKPWPTLGPGVCDWIEEFMVYGPGDLLGERVTLTDELRLYLYRAYEVYPRGHALEGRRRFKRVVLSRRKGVGKTEVAAWVACAELDPHAPVRCDGWRNEGTKGDPLWVPVGRAVFDPYIPMVAYTEEQSTDLAFSAVYECLTRGPLADQYDCGLERVTHIDAPGIIQPLASAPNARDGARTTHQHFDETGRFTSPRLKDSHQVMLRNVPKRRAADAWSHETTTMFSPGEESVAELSAGYAEDIAAGKVEDPRMYYDHRQAGEGHDLGRPSGLLAAIREASGDAWSFTDADGIAALYYDPTTDRNEWRRFWLNQRRKSGVKWLGDDALEPVWVAPRELLAEPEDSRPSIVLAFDGSSSRDSTALVGCTVEAKPYVWVVRAWERPSTARAWRTPRGEVLDAVDEAVAEYDVVELAPDPPGWYHEVEGWEDQYGELVVRFETNQPSRMGPATDEFTQAIREQLVSLARDPRLAKHIDNAKAVRRDERLLIKKSHPDSPDKIDLAVGAIVAYSRARWHYTNMDREDDMVAVYV